MVLESVIKSRFALNHPLAMLFFAIVITTISIGISLSTFEEYSSLLSIAFITIGSMPILFQIFVQEEKSEAEHPANPATFLGRHFHIIKVFAFLFIGIVIAYTFWYVYLPAENHASVFKEQEKNWQRISNLRGQVTQDVVVNSCESKDFWILSTSCIFTNNAIVLTWSLVLAFFYGAGAIFLIAWNASVIGLVLGKEILINGLLAGILKILGLVFHGTLEIGAYLIGAIAGGIVSAAIARKVYLKKEFETIGKDVLIMVAIAYAILLIAAFIEAAAIISP